LRPKRNRTKEKPSPEEITLCNASELLHLPAVSKCFALLACPPLKCCISTPPASTKFPAKPTRAIDFGQLYNGNTHCTV
ncbi:MAG: hypothetical protein RR465_06065, partial [Mucinivorans sp.]